MNLKRSLALALSLLMILSVIPVFGAGETLDRISGANRWATAVEICQEGWDSADTVVLASGEKFADALAGVTLAYANDAPVLLTASDSLVKEAKDEIVRLGANKVFLLGGTVAISADIEEELTEMGLEVVRVKGAGRAETAAEIAPLVAPDGADTVVLAYAWDFPDALAAASYAAIKGYPILLTEKTSVSEATEAAIEDLGAENVILVGGTGVITAAVEDALEDADLNVVRVSGSNREATSVALANYFKLNTTMYYIATGDGFADAIAGAALAAKNGTGILLVRKTMNETVAKFVNDNVTEAVIFGGTGAVSSTIADAIEDELLTGIGGIVGWTTAEEVTIAGKTIEPDDDDFFKITGVAPGSYKAYFKAAGYKTTAVDVVVIKDRLTVVEATYGDSVGTGSIKGIVVDEDGAPLQGSVALEIWDEDEEEWVDGTGIETIDATGIFTLTTGIAAGGKYRVTISMVDGALEEVYHDKVFVVTLPEDEGAKDLGLIEMELVDSMTLSGIVKDAEGNVVADDADLVQLTALGVILTADTDEDGKFEFADLTLPSGKYTLSVDLGDGEHAAYSATVSVTEGSDRTHNVYLKYGYELSFTLRSGSTDDLDLTNAGVEVEELEIDMTLTEGVFTTTLAPGTYTLVASGDYVITAKYTVKIVDANLSIAKQITPAGAISVDVAHDALVELINADGKVVDSAEAVLEDEAASDTVTFTGLPVGAEYTIRVSAEDKKTDHFDADGEEVAVVVNTTTEAFETAVSLDGVDTVGQVSGYVRMADGYPAADATVTYYFNDVEEETKGDPVTDHDGVDVGDNGYYEVTALDPGTYDVVVRAAGHENYVASMTVKAGDDKTFTNYRLVAGGDATLELVVKDVEGDLVSEDSLILKDAYGMEIDVPAADEDGIFVIEDLAAGTYTLTRGADADNAALAEKIVVKKGETVNANFKLVDPAVQYEITLWLVDEDYADITTAEVYVGSVDTDYTEKANGYYSVSLVNGTYTAEIYVADYLYETVEFTVKDGAKVLPQVQLTPAE